MKKIVIGVILILIVAMIGFLSWSPGADRG